MSEQQTQLGHVHSMRWLPEPVYTYDDHFRLVAVNVECTECGARQWAHGRMPCDSRPTTEGAEHGR